MKLKRVLLFGSLAVLVLLVALVALAFNSGVQTWAVRRALKGQPDLSVEVGRVSVGLQSVVLSQITLRQPGLKLTLPEVTSELSVIDAVSRKVRVRRVKAHGWTLDLTAPAPLAAGGSPERRAVAGYFAVLSGVNGNASAAPAPKAEAFAGIFGLLRLPVELSLEDADLAGAVIFPTAAGQPAGRAVVTVTGGKLGAAREGRFRVEAKAEMSGAVSQLTATSDIGLRMDAPDSIDRVSAVTDLVAVGSRFPGGGPAEGGPARRARGSGRRKLPRDGGGGTKGAARSSGSTPGRGDPAGRRDRGVGAGHRSGAVYLGTHAACLCRHGGRQVWG
jgi:hypothetical protein